MHERRQAARFTYQSAVRYCSSSDFSPREGYATNLSEDGGGLLLREPHESGQWVTVNVLTPREAVPLAMTGSVQWASDRRLNGHGFPVGVEWLPVDEGAHHRLQELLAELAKEPAALAPRHATVRRMRAVMWGMAAGLVISGIVWVGRRWQAQTWPERLLANRNAAVAQLRREAADLRSALREADAQLLATSRDVNRLSGQAGQLEGAARVFHQSLAALQASDVLIRQERDALIRRVLSLEQERLQLIRRSVPPREVERAVREAIAARTHRPPVAAGNRGYLVQAHRSSAPRPAMWIRVHQPESGVSSDTASR